MAPTWIASWPRNWPQRPSSPCRCRFSASWSARRISTMFRYSSRSAAASRPRRLLPSAVSSPAGEKRARTGSSAATTRTTSAIAGNILYRSYVGDPSSGTHEHREAEHLPGLSPSLEDRRRLPAARRLPPRGGAADAGGLYPRHTHHNHADHQIGRVGATGSSAESNLFRFERGPPRPPTTVPQPARSRAPARSLRILAGQALGRDEPGHGDHVPVG